MNTDSISAEPLTPDERLILVDSETTIKIHLHDFYTVGHALMQIRDNRLYRVTHSTFELYCKERWNISRPRAYQHIKSAGVHDTLSTTVDISERAIRPLTRPPPEKQREVFQKAVDTAPDGKVTSRHVEETVKLETNAEQAQINPNPPHIGVSFRAAWDAMAEEIARENLTGWQQTDRHVAIEYVRKLLDRIVSYTIRTHGDGTDKTDDEINNTACRCGQYIPRVKDYRE